MNTLMIVSMGQGTGFAEDALRGSVAFDRTVGLLAAVGQLAAWLRTRRLPTPLRTAQV